MVLFLQHPQEMKKVLLLSFSAIAAATILVACSSASRSLHTEKQVNLQHINKVIYLNPEIEPDVEEIKDATYSAFFSAVSDEIKEKSSHKMLRINNTLKYDSVDQNTIREFCVNNDSQLLVVPKVKYFKVGFGKYVFSNQVLVSLKLYDSEGNFVMETSYDTYRGKGRLLGNTENSIKIGTKQAMELMNKGLRTQNKANHNPT